MNLLRILHAAIASAPFIVAQSASAAIGAIRPDVSAAQASSDSASVPDKDRRQRSLSSAPAVAGARRNTEAGAYAEGPREIGKAQRGINQAAHANSDRVRALLNRQALRAHVSGRPRMTVAASRNGTASTAAQTIATGGAPRASSYTGSRAVNPSPGRTNLSQEPASAAMRNGAAPRATVALPQNSVARTGILGGPGAHEHARLGGPSLGKPAHAAALDGTQILRRKY
jgi:hypothetical protein